MCHSLEVPCDLEPDALCGTTNPWISIQIPGGEPTIDGIDFNPPSLVQWVEVYNRPHTDWWIHDRLSPFQIWIGQSPGDWRSETSDPEGHPLETSRNQ